MRALRSVLVLASLTGCASSGADLTPGAPASTEVPETFQPRVLSSDVRANVPVLPEGLTSFGAAEHDGLLYVLGGYSGRPHAYSAKDQHGELLAYDPDAEASERWTVASEVPPVQGAALVSHRTGLIRIGGMRALNPTTDVKSELVSLDTVQRFEPASGWSDLPPLPEGRSSHDAVVIGDTLYVVGGWRLDHEARKGTWAADMLTLDLSDPEASWSRAAAPFARRALAVATAGGKLYVLGGMDAERAVSQQVEVYDPASRRWTRADDFPGQGFGMAAVGAEGAVFASGADGTVYRLDAKTNHWAEATRSVLPRFFHRLVATADGTVWAMGGIRPDTQGARVRLTEPVAGERVTEAITVQLPSPMASKNRQGAAVLGDDVYFFGGNDSLGQHDFGPEHFTAGGFRFDLATLQWAEVADYPRRRQTMSVATRDGSIVAFGGFGHDGEAARTHPEVYVYDPASDRWSPTEGSLPKPRGRTQFGLAAAADRWWIFGGLDYDPSRPKDDQFRHEAPILSAPIDLKTDFEPSGASLTESRRAFAGAKFDDAYVVVGGMREGFALVETCEAFTFASATWSPFPCPSAPRLSSHLVALGDRLVLVAGSSKGADGALAPDPSLEVYEDGAWHRASVELPLQPTHLHAFAWNENLLVMSTHAQGDTLDLAVLRSAAIQ